MIFIKTAPLFRTLIIVNILLLCMLGVPYFWPLPAASNVDQNSGQESFEALIGVALATDIKPAQERPVFHVNRRPAQIVQLPQQVVQVHTERKLNIQLMGIVQTSNGERVAYLQNTDTNETFSARAADTTVGWTIEVIQADSVILVNGSRRKMIDLNSGG